jgi:hypothetical protein
MNRGNASAPFPAETEQSFLGKPIVWGVKITRLGENVLGNSSDQIMLKLDRASGVSKNSCGLDQESSQPS